MLFPPGQSRAFGRQRPVRVPPTPGLTCLPLCLCPRSIYSRLLSPVQFLQFYKGRDRRACCVRTLWNCVEQMETNGSRTGTDHDRHKASTGLLNPVLRVDFRKSSGTYWFSRDLYKHHFTWTSPSHSSVLQAFTVAFPWADEKDGCLPPGSSHINREANTLSRGHKNNAAFSVQHVRL